MSSTPGFAGNLRLGESEVRVLGCLLEKQRTTPDAYPLSLNALRLACNQSTNRDPVVDYDDAVIRDALHRLERRGFVRLASGAGSRAAKYRHLLAEALPMDDGEQAAMAVLMLRGAQTPGELKQRTERMHAFADLDAVHATLLALIERGLVARLARRPGQKEERYTQLLEEEEEEAETREPRATPLDTVAETVAALAEGTQEPGVTVVAVEAGDYEQLRERVERLERAVAELREELRSDTATELAS